MVVLLESWGTNNLIRAYISWGVIRFIWEAVDENSDNEYVSMNYLLFAMILFTICTAIHIIVSLLTEGKNEVRFLFSVLKVLKSECSKIWYTSISKINAAPCVLYPEQSDCNLGTWNIFLRKENPSWFLIIQI